MTFFIKNKIISSISFFFLFLFLLNKMSFAKPIYVDAQLLYPSQIRFSSKNVEDKIKKAQAKKKLFSNGKSIFDLSEALPVIKRPDGTYILADGHHSFLASRALNKNHFIPIEVIGSYTGKKETFWAWAKKNNYAYLTSIEGKEIAAPKNWDALADDELRYFAAISARKFEKDTQIQNSTGPDYPLWVKTGKGRVHFIEFIMANHLHKYGFKCTYADLEKPEQLQILIEQARIIFQKHPLDHCDILETSEHYTQSKKIPKLLSEFNSIK